MCGITGIYFSKKGNSQEVWQSVSQRIEVMVDALSSRGPDNRGVFLTDGLALGHTRLSVLDTSSAGDQPMTLLDSGITISYNGECYNYRTLRNELQALGRVFNSGSDTEVILHIYHQWGLAGLKRLEGIFALAIWDTSSKRLILMRDRFGVKPLFYGESELGLAFGSEIKAVILAGGVDTDIDDQSLSEYMWFGNTHQDRSFYKGIRQLEPGHLMIVEGDREPVIQAWWRLEEWLQDSPSYLDREQLTSNVGVALDKAVKRQLVSDVPVGLFLSGGIDSSSIAASVDREQASYIKSFAAEFDSSDGVSELEKARVVANKFGFDHYELKIAGSDMPDALSELAKAHDEPFADAANLALYCMCKRLPNDIKVVLQGDGGDEIFGGYRRYAMLRNARLWRLLPKFIGSSTYNMGSYGRRFARMIDSLGHQDSGVMMALLLTMETKNLPPERFFSADKRADLLANTDPFEAYHYANERFAGHEIVQKMLLTDLTTQLPSQFLPKVDRATMAAGIESRVPFLDENLVKLAVNIPSIFKTRGVEKKIILRNSQRSRLPASILDGPKTGFGVPYQNWLRTSLYGFAREVILDKSTISRWSLDAPALEKALQHHKSGKIDNGFILWKILQLGLFKSPISHKQY